MQAGLDLITHNWTLKLAALGLAVLLWSVTRTDADTPTRVAITDVPVEVSLRDPDWTLAEPPDPPRVSILFSMPAQEPLLIGESPRVIVPVDEVEDSMEVREIRVEWIRLQGDLDPAWIEEIRPSEVRLSFERVIERDLPVAARTRGQLPTGYRRTGPVETRPATVRVRGRTRRVGALDSVPLRPVDLTGMRDTTTVRGGVDTAAVSGLDVEPGVIRVTVPVAPLGPDTAAAGTGDTVALAGGAAFAMAGDAGG